MSEERAMKDEGPRLKIGGRIALLGFGLAFLVVSLESAYANLILIPSGLTIWVLARMFIGFAAGASFVFFALQKSY